VSAQWECRPPEGTPDGAVCVLRVTYAFPEGAKSVEKDWVWTGLGWIADLRSPGNCILTVDGMTRHGWKFVALATPPQEPR